MELRVNEYQLPEAITFNYEELKQELTEKVSMYTNLVYTDEQIKEAKADKASLNKLKKALNDERIRLEREYMQPFNDTKAKFNEIIAIIDKPVALIDQQVKGYEEKCKQDKLEKIQEYFVEHNTHEFLSYDMIADPKWLNASTSMKSIQEAIDAKIEQIANDRDTLQNLPEFGFEATEVYKTTLDINKALNEGKRLSEIAKAKAAHEAEMKARAEEQARLAAEAEAKKAEQVEGQVEFTDASSFDENVVKPAQEGFINPPVEEVPAKKWVKFQALISYEDGLALRQFFNDRKIEFKAV